MSLHLIECEANKSINKLKIFYINIQLIICDLIMKKLPFLLCEKQKTEHGMLHVKCVLTLLNWIGYGFVSN